MKEVEVVVLDLFLLNLLQIMPPKKRARFGPKPCVVCGASIAHVRRHLNREHMPWYMSPLYACVDCHYAGDVQDLTRFHGNHRRFHGDYLMRAWFLLVNGFFLLISRSLGLPSINSLIEYVVAEQLFTPLPGFSEEEGFFVREYDRLAGLAINQNLSSNPPNRISQLLHFRVLANLLQKVNPEDRTRLRTTLNYVNPDGSSPQLDHPILSYSVIDSHFHLEMLVDRSRKSFRELEVSHSTVNLVHAIANFVYPSKWSKIPGLMATDSRLRLSLGVHPHLIQLNNVEIMFNRLQNELRKHPSAVAVGEVGLDFTTQCKCGVRHDKSACKSRKIQAQHIFLDKVLKLAHDLGKPIIIHCRDNNNGEAAKGVLKAITSLNLTDMPIHRHCFIGTIEEFDEWSNRLPNCYFSLSGMSVQHSKTRDAILMCGHHRLLLETDSPYLPLSDDPGHGPWTVGKIADIAAPMMAMSTIEFITLCNRNAANLYGLPW